MIGIEPATSATARRYLSPIEWNTKPLSSNVSAGSPTRGFELLVNVDMASILP